MGSIKILVIFFLTLVFSGTGMASDLENMSLADHEIAAAEMSFSEAVDRQNQMIQLGERHKVIPYIKRAYTLIHDALVQNPAIPAENEKFMAIYEDIGVQYGNVLTGARRLEEAHEHLAGLLTIIETWHGPHSLRLVDTLMALGMSRIEYRGSKGSNAYFDRALELARKHEGDNSSLVGKLYLDISQASLVHASGDWRKASRKLKQAHKMLVEKEGGDSRDAAVSAYRIGELAVIREKYDEAANYLEQAAEVFDSIEPNARTTQRMHELLVKTYSNLGKDETATKHCQMVGKIKEANGDTEKDGLGYMPIHRAQPRYPRAAIERSQEGQVTIELTVTAEGTPADIRVLSNEGPRSLIKASIKAAEKFRYAARHENGEPVDTKGVQYRFSFNIAR